MSEAPEGKVIEIGPRFRLVPFDKVVLGSEPVYLVKKLIPRTGLTVVWGPPKCGKSFWTFDLVMHVALGWEYRGRRVAQGSVVYLALEGGKGFEARIEAFRQRFLADDHDPVPFYLVADALNLVKEHPQLIGCIRTQVKGAPPAVVVIDTLNRSLAGSESEDKDMAAYIRAADAIRNAFMDERGLPAHPQGWCAGCAVIVIHHCGVDATRPRGHTSLAGAVDAQLAVKRDAMENIVVTVERMKDEPDGDTLVSRLEPVDVGHDTDGDAISSCVVAPSEQELANGPRVSGATKMALNLLQELISEEGTTGTNSRCPAGVKTVPVSLWKTYCYKASGTDSEDPNSKRKAFNRACKKLQELNMIGIWDERVWIATKTSGTSGTKRDMSCLSRED
jgi:AAA domain